MEVRNGSRTKMEVRNGIVPEWKRSMDIYLLARRLTAYVNVMAMKKIDPSRLP